MRCVWCGTELYFLHDRELGGGMQMEKETNQPHNCKPFLEWEKSIGLHGPTLSESRYQLWEMGPEKASKSVELQKKAREPLLPFFKKEVTRK